MVYCTLALVHLVNCCTAASLWPPGQVPCILLSPNKAQLACPLTISGRGWRVQQGPGSLFILESTNQDTAGEEYL